MKGIRKFLSLSDADKSIFVNAGLMLVAVRLLVSFLPFQMVRSILDKISNPGPGRIAPVEMESIIRAVHFHSKRIKAVNRCLVRAMAAQVLLSRAGIQTKFVFGAKRSSSEEFMAHAWLEHEGKVVIGEDEHDFFQSMCPSRTGQG